MQLLPGRQENDAQTETSRMLAFAVVVGFWTLLGLLYAGQYYLGLNSPDEGGSWWRLASWQLLVHWVWAALTPAILWLGRRFSLERPQRWRALVAHALSGSLVSIIYIGAYTWITRALGIYPDWRINRPLDQFVHFAWMYFHLSLFTYFAVLGIGLAFDYYRKYRERELQAAELRAQLAQAQLEALRIQLHPHFLFNTLNSIVGLIRSREERAAIRMTTGLSELLRHALERTGRQEVPLREELEFLQRYLDIQQMRFSDRLTVELEIAAETLEASVPSLILQPIVENAIRHGIAARASSGLLRLSASGRNGELQISVYNDGPVLPANWRLEDCSGIGLANARARLERLYGTRCRLEVFNCGARGVETRLTIPLQRIEPGLNGHDQENGEEKDPRADRR